MTGSLSESEDIVQDTFIEALKISPENIEQPKSWLTKVCLNKSIDHLKLAYKKRETYPGTWLPDAIPDSYQFWDHLVETPSPETKLALSESLTFSFLILAERLSPEERAIYLLKEIFGYPFKEIAELLQKSESACRKIAERARKAIEAGERRFTPSDHPERIIERFFNSVKQGDQEAILELLDESSEFWADGGGKVAALRKVLKDSRKTAMFFAFIGKSVTDPENTKVEFQYVNSRPGVVIAKKQVSGLWLFESILSFEIDGEKILRIYSQRSPDKLKKLLTP